MALSSIHVTPCTTEGLISSWPDREGEASAACERGLCVCALATFQQAESSPALWGRAPPPVRGQWLPFSKGHPSQLWRPWRPSLASGFFSSPLIYCQRSYVLGKQTLTIPGHCTLGKSGCLPGWKNGPCGISTCVQAGLLFPVVSRGLRGLLRSRTHRLCTWLFWAILKAPSPA